MDVDLATERVGLYVGMFGDLNDIFWEIEFKDSASIHNLSAKLLADQEHRSITSRAEKTGLFVEGSAHDSLMGERSVKETLARAGESSGIIENVCGKMTLYKVTVQQV